MSLSHAETKELTYPEARAFSTDLIHPLNETQLLRVLSDLDPTAGEDMTTELTSSENPQAAQYFREQGMVEFFLSNRLADAIVFPGILGKLQDLEADKITQISSRQPSQKRKAVITHGNNQSAHSPPQLAK